MSDFRRYLGNKPNRLDFSDIQMYEVRKTKKSCSDFLDVKRSYYSGATRVEECLMKREIRELQTY